MDSDSEEETKQKAMKIFGEDPKSKEGREKASRLKKLSKLERFFGKDPRTEEEKQASAAAAAPGTQVTEAAAAPGGVVTNPLLDSLQQQ